MSKKVKRTPLSPAARAYLKAKREVWERTLGGQIRQAALTEVWMQGLWIAQYRFMQGRRWAFDLCSPGSKVAVEVDGGVWNQGQHVRGKGITNDHEKTAEAMCQGWLVLRVTPDQIKNGQAIW